MKHRIALASALASAFVLAQLLPASAHMQMIAADSLLVARPGPLTLTLSFGHVDGSGPMLDMPRPARLTVIHEVQRQSLLDDLTEAEAGKAFQVPLRVDGFGDYVVALEGAPYFDPAEGAVVEQFTKAVLNLGGAPSDWFDQIGLPVEIVPMVKPYAVPAGSVFTGRVVTRTGAVGYTQVELIRVAGNPADPPERPWPGALTVITDDEGIFNVTIPAAGSWLLAAYGAGPQKRTDTGQPLTQDALLVVQAHDWFR